MLELIARGLSNGEIAAAARHRGVDGEDARQAHPLKLRLRDRVQAVIFAYESGLARPGAPAGT